MWTWLQDEVLQQKIVSKRCGTRQHQTCKKKSIAKAKATYKGKGKGRAAATIESNGEEEERRGFFRIARICRV